MAKTVIVVHNPIRVNDVDYATGDRIAGDLADEILANEIWAKSVTRAPAGVHADLEAEGAPAASVAPPPPPPAPAPTPPNATITDTSTKP